MFFFLEWLIFFLTCALIMQYYELRVDHNKKIESSTLVIPSCFYFTKSILCAKLHPKQNPLSSKKLCSQVNCWYTLYLSRDSLTLKHLPNQIWLLLEQYILLKALVKIKTLFILHCSSVIQYPLSSFHIKNANLVSLVERVKVACD